MNKELGAEYVVVYTKGDPPRSTHVRGKLVYVFPAGKVPDAAQVVSYMGIQAPGDAYMICNKDRYVLQTSAHRYVVFPDQLGYVWGRI